MRAHAYCSLAWLPPDVRLILEILHLSLRGIMEEDTQDSLA